MAGDLESSSSCEDSDVLMIDPFLDYINEMLMEEGTEDVDDTSYQAIFKGFYDILGEHLPPNSSVDSTSYEGVFDPHFQHRSMHCYHANGIDEHDVKIVNPNDEHHVKIVNANNGFYSFTELPQNYHNAIKSDDGVLMDAVVEALSGHIGQEQNGKLKLPSADEEFSSKLAEVDIMSFEDLKLSAVYTDLYVGEPRSSTRASRDSKPNGEKKKSFASTGSTFGKESTFVDVREALMSCAQFVAIGDSRRANEILQELYQVDGASATGTGLQRTAYFFSKALAARMGGMGEHEFRALSHNMPSAMMLLKASKVWFEVSPFLKLMHYFANQSILKAAEGASRLHIVDYGSTYSMQWPCLINALADRKGGPPLLVITCIEFPQPGIKLAERLDGIGQRLASYAKTYNVPFQYHAIVTNKWEDVDAASLHLHEGEVLVINCINRLRHVADESDDLALTISPRQKLLTCMHSLNPHLLLTSVVSAAYNSTFFVSRFREALYYFSNLFDMLDTLWGDTPQRLIVERSCFYPVILNIVACEGAERVERPETYKQWFIHIMEAGFEQLPIPATILSRSKSHVKQHYHKEFLIQDVNGWMLMGWRGRTVLAIAAWKPSLVQRC